MAKLTIIYWRDIPAQVIGQQGRKRHKQVLDNRFAVAIDRYNQPDRSPHKHWYYLGSGLFMYLNWQLCTFLGVTIGQLLPNLATWGLEFAMPVTFIGMIIPYLKNKPMWAAVVVASVVAMVGRALPHQLGLMLAAVSGILTGVLLEGWLKPAGEEQSYV